jgi:DNA-binding LacI/PurR family transcriptional regulator
MKEFGTMRLKDIAEKLNVSISTVSRALGKETSDKVAPDLRAKICETAARLTMCRIRPRS